ncbi:AMP-dependent synthetase/ligase [Demequina sp.]|uniref:AMP-dependent synthetase/ligase n=1 Tax=Demequina sp. TaxID=2050685 RepID=UPI003D0E25BB
MWTEMSSPSLVTPEERCNLTQLLARRAATEPDQAFAENKGEGGTWTPLTIKEFHAQVRAVAKGLVAKGIAPGERVGIMGDTRYEWAVMDFAVLAAGAISVPIYPSSSTTQLAWIMADAGITHVATDLPERAEAVAEASGRVLDMGALSELETAGQAITDEELDARTADVLPDDLATIIYTSGTTGRPKGAMLSHANFVDHVLNIERDPDFGGFVQGDARLLLFLPLAHVFGRLAMVLAMSAGVVTAFAPSHKTLAADMASFRPTVITVVPRVLETIYNRADAAQHGAKKRIFRWAAKVAREYGATVPLGKPSAALKARHKIADRLVLAKIRHLTGGQLQYALSGGARLNEDVGNFFEGVGVTILQGYGLTETTAAALGTPEPRRVIGTVGRPLSGTEAAVDEDGEILLRGANLFLGYWNAPDATAAVMRDGWFATGDLGRITDGALSVVGRKKEILVLSSGKNVQPAVLEDSIRTHPAIQDSVVVGEGRHFVSALVALDEVMLPDWLTAHSLPSMTVEEASRDSRVRELVSRAVAMANSHVSRAESIREFRIVPSSFSEAREEMTASLKVRRDRVLANYADVVEEMYSAAKPQGA